MGFCLQPKLQTSAIARRFLVGAVALVALSWPAVAVAQPASTAILSIGDGHMICVRLPISLNSNLAVVEAWLAGQGGSPAPAIFAPNC
jgi:hypothetical protein